MNKKSNWLDRATALLEVIEKGRANTFERFDAVAKSGLLDIPFERYGESIEWYCGSDADRKQAKENGVCGPLLFDDEFQEDLLFLLNTPLVELCNEEDPRLYNLPGAGMGLIQTIYFGVCSIAKNTTNVKEAKKCEFFKELFDQFGYETGAWFQAHGASGDLVRMIRRKAEKCVEVDKSAGKSLRAALQDPGGRPQKTHCGAKVMTQAEMAELCKAKGKPQPTPTPTNQGEDKELSDWEWLISQRTIIGARFEVKYDMESDKLTITNYKIPANKKIKQYTKIKKQLQREIIAKLIRRFAESPKSWHSYADYDISQLFKNGEYKRFRDNEIENEMAANGTYTGKRRIYTNDDFVKRFDELK